MKLEGFGIRAEIDVQDRQQTAGENPVDRKLPEPQALEPSNRIAVNEMELRLKADLASIDVNKREAVLVRALAEARMTSGHEFTYNRIFGSEILALRRLNAITHATVDNAREFFQPFREQFPLIYNNYDFDRWLGFLKNSGLISQEGLILKITEIGRDFLVYLTEKRLFEGKAG
jgi:hypothetical protein